MANESLYTRLDEMIVALERIMAKTEINADDKKFLKGFAKNLGTFTGFAFERYKVSEKYRRINYTHINYLINSPVFSYSERKKIKEEFDRFITRNGISGDFSKVDPKNFNFGEFVVPSVFIRDETKRKELYDCFKGKKRGMCVSWEDVPFLGELENFNISVYAGRLGTFPLHLFKTFRNIIKDRIGKDEIDFYSDDVLAAMKEYYNETKDPNIGIETQINLGVDYNVGVIRKGSNISFSYSEEGINKALKLVEALDKAGRTDVAITFSFPTEAIYGSISSEERKKLIEKLRPLRNRKKIGIVFDRPYNDEQNFLTLNGYFKSLEYYDRIAAKIKSMNLSPYEEYLKAFNYAKTFKRYREFHNPIVDEDYPNYSRNPFLILKNKYQVCTGYAFYLQEVLDRLDIECGFYSLDCKKNLDSYDPAWHARLLVHINDPKYDIDKVIISDPTASSFLPDKFHIIPPHKNKLAVKRAELKYTSSSCPHPAAVNACGEDWVTEQLSNAVQNFNKTLAKPVDLDQVQILELPKLFWAMRNIKKKENKKLSRKGLDNYASKMLNEFLHDPYGVFCLVKYVEQGKIDSLIYFLNMPMFGIKEKLEVIRTISREMPVYTLLEHPKIKEIFLTNLKNISWIDLQYMPGEFRTELLTRIFRLGGLDISEVLSLGDRVTYEVLGKAHTKLYNSTDNIFTTVEKSNQLKNLFELRKNAVDLASSVNTASDSRRRR